MLFVVTMLASVSGVRSQSDFFSRLNYYTSESTAEFLLNLPPELQNIPVTITVGINSQLAKKVDTLFAPPHPLDPPPVNRKPKTVNPSSLDIRHLTLDIYKVLRYLR